MHTHTHIFHTHTHTHTHPHAQARNTQPRPQVSRTQLLGTGDPKMVTCPITSFCTCALECTHSRTRTYAHHPRSCAHVRAQTDTVPSGFARQLTVLPSRAHACTHARTHARAHARTHAPTHTYAHTHAHTHTRTHTQWRNTQPRPQVPRTQLPGTGDPKRVRCPIIGSCMILHGFLHRRKR